MKKKLIALAVLGAVAAVPAMAQSNVTIGGYMAIQVKNYKLSDLNSAARGLAQNATNEFRVDDDANSRIWFTGKEDLGDGLDAHFYLESRFGGDNGSAASTFGLAAGNTFVGLGSKSMGTLDLGRLETYYIQGAGIEADRTSVSAHQANKAIMGVMGGQTINRLSRNDNNIRYISPIMGGFKATVVYSPNYNVDEGKIPAAGTTPVNNAYSKGNAWTLAGEYANGPLFLNAAYWRVTTEGKPGDLVATPNTGYVTTAQADQKAWRVSGSYMLPFGLKIGLMYDKSRLDNVRAGQLIGSPASAAAGGGTVLANGAVSRSAWMLPISYTFGAHAIYAKYAVADDLSNFKGAKAGGSGAKFYNLAYDYALSKRTAFGVSYTVINNDPNGTYQINGAGTTGGGSLLVAGEKASSIQFNLKHSF